MARSRSPDSIEAEKLYYFGMSLADIAREMGKPEGTVRRWKSTQKWDSERSGRKASVRKNNRKKIEKVIAEEVDQVIKNPDLTDKQRLFCCIYIKCFNATKAYQKAYECSYDVANAEGYKLLVNPCVKAEIHKLKQNRLNQEMLSEADIFQKYMDIAFADITDYTEFGTNEIIDPESGETVKYSYVHLKSSKGLDGTIISEVSKGKDGAKIKLNDRMKALQWISDHMDLATEEQKVRIEQIRTSTEKMKQESRPEDAEGVEIINDAPEKSSQDIETSDTEIPADI